MTKKNGFSKRTLTMIEYLWFAVSMMIAVSLKDNLNLNFIVYMCIAASLYIIGEIMIKKFIKDKK